MPGMMRMFCGEDWSVGSALRHYSVGLRCIRDSHSPRGESAALSVPKRDTIHIRDELVLEAHPDGLYILLQRESEPDAVRVYPSEARYLADVLCAMVE